MEKRHKYVSKNTIQQTAIIIQPFGTDKSVPYEHAGRRPIHPTFVNPLKQNISHLTAGSVNQDWRLFRPCDWQICMAGKHTFV